jgi:hypothetical protein
LSATKRSSGSDLSPRGVGLDCRTVRCARGSAHR